MEFIDAKNTLCSAKLNIDYDDVVSGENQLFSLNDIEDAVNYGIRKAWDYKLWPFAEGNIDTSGSTSGGVNPFVISEFGTDFQEQSFFLAIVSGVPWFGEGAGKRNFRDFMQWLSDNPTDTSKIWAEYGGQFFFNLNALPANYELDIYGKFHAPLYSNLNGDDSNAMPFSVESADDTTSDSSGNDAIILFAYAFLLGGEKKKNPNQAAIEEKNAYAILDTIWAFIAEGKAQNQPMNRPFFNVDNFFPGRSNRNNTNIGNFP
jgi:hypothetical protein